MFEVNPLTEICGTKCGSAKRNITKEVVEIVKFNVFSINGNT